MKTSWSTLRSMFISGSSRRPDQSFFFISQASNGMNSFSLRQTENIQILHWPRKSPFIKACAIANVMNFQPLVDFFNLPGLNIIQFLSFFREFAFLTERRKKIALLSLFPSLACPPFSRFAMESMRITWGQWSRIPGNEKNKCSSRWGKSLIY